MSAALAYESPRFLRRTRLQPHEYNKNFKMLDEETLAAVTSPEADAVTPLMSKIYLRLIQAPAEYCRKERELHFGGEVREGKRVKAWDQLCQHLRTSSETAQKALRWMHEQGIIGYSAFKNGVGIFIFINRAASSVGVRSPSRDEKILQFSSASVSNRPASPSAAAFNDPFGDLDSSDKKINPHTPKNGVEVARNENFAFKPTSETAREASPPPSPTASTHDVTTGRDAERHAPPPAAAALQVDEIIRRLRNELEPKLLAVAAQASAREHKQTREWLDKHGIPKAARVAQKEAYNVLRSQGARAAADAQRRADLQVGRTSESYTKLKARPLTPEEVADFAETSVALLELQGKPIELTLAEATATTTTAAGECEGWLLPADRLKVREAAYRLLEVRGAAKKG